MFENVGVKVFGTGIMTFLTGVIGGWDLSLKVLFTLIAIDIVTGVLKGIYFGKLRSKRIREGIITKAGYILILILGFQFDVLLNNNEPIIRTCVAWLYIFTEGVSILENLAEMGIPVPKKLMDVLGKIKETSGGFVTKEDMDEKK